MAWAEFVEKEFEGPLYNQLLFGDPRLATPSQVFEGHFGIDAALNALHPLFWDCFGYPNIPDGIVLDHFNWGFVWRKLGRTRPLPNFATNLLIQSKRPEIVLKRGATVGPGGAVGPMWKFSIRMHQQAILEKVARTLGNRALVIYATTAFDTFSELNDHTVNNSMVENCNYVRIVKLKGHSSWSYSQAGTQGVAQSNPENIDDLPLEQMIGELVDSSDGNADPSEYLESLRKDLRNVLNESVNDIPVAGYILKRLDYYQESSALRENDQYASSFFEVSSIFRFLGLRWFAAG